MTGSMGTHDERGPERAESRKRRASLTWRLRASLRASEHLLRRAVADRRMPAKAVSVLPRVLPFVESFGDTSVLDRTDKVAVVASYGATSAVSRSLAALVDEFEANGYTVVLVRASESPDELVWPATARRPSLTIRKPNIGYDFGSWATAMAVFPAIIAKRRVILANDSLLGPFAPLASMFADFERSSSDVWGATDTLEYLPHLQSYLLGFTDGVLAHPAVRSFWRSIRVIEDKDAIVTRYEIGLSRLLATEGFVSRAWFAHGRIVPEGGNPTTIGGSRLLAAGFPFVKRILIENPQVFPDAAVAAATVAELFDENVQDWL